MVHFNLINIKKDKNNATLAKTKVEEKNPSDLQGATQIKKSPVKTNNAAAGSNYATPALFNLEECIFLDGA